MLELNQRISLKSNTKISGKIISFPITGVVEIVWDNGDVETLREDEIEVEELTFLPWEKLAKNQFDDYRNFTISSIVSKVKNTNANVISTLKASKTIFKPYQFIPLLKLLNSEKKRIIIADEVGLGKTISAGNIILELAARGELNSLLIVCLNSIQKKWMDELINKFNVKVVVFESLREFKKSIDGFQNYGDKIFGIINYDKFRQKKELEYFQKNAIGFDLMIFDEVHTLRNDTNSRKSLKCFTDQAKSIVMLTATPIMTSLENLYSLVRLLDEQYFSNYQIFQNTININKPFVKAYNQLNAGVSCSEIAKELKLANIDQYFKYGENQYKSSLQLTEILSEVELFKNILNELESISEISITEKVRLQGKLIELNSLNYFYTRTRKKEVLLEESSVMRNPIVIEIPMNDSEMKIYEDKLDEMRNSIGDIQKQRSFTSSLFAHAYTQKDYDNKINIEADDSKYNALVNVIKQQKSERVIIFSFFTNTLKYLNFRLIQNGFKVGLIYGHVKMTDRNLIIEDFSNNKFQILLSSEVGSTGLDLQFCNRMVNYDLPWNPMVIEQRIGRIDRIGQQSKVINIFNFIYKGTIEERIYYRLYDRINLFRESLGNLDEILGEKETYIEGIVEMLYKKNLSEQDENQMLSEVASAIERNKLDMQTIDIGLQDSFSNDSFFETSIKQIDKNRQYVTEADLIELINRVIANELTTLTFNKIDSDNSIFLIKQTNQEDIFEFIEKHYDSHNEELKQIFRVFKKRNYEKSIKCTFNQNYAFNNKSFEFLSAYHPFINAITNYFIRNRLNQNSVFRFSLNRKYLNDIKYSNLFSGKYYFLVRYNFEVKKVINGKQTNISFLKSLLMNMDGDEIVLNDNESSDYFFSICQQFITSMSADDANIEFNYSLMNAIKVKFTHFLLDEKQKLESEEKIKFESELQRRLTQESFDISKRIELLTYNIQNKIGIERILKSEIKDLEKRQENLQSQNQASTIHVNSKLISLNFISIYG
jgi:superfamily II DNA or RNA helicase